MFEEFSAGYYLGQITVAPHDGEHAVMDRERHEEANARVYTEGEGVERLDLPLVMKVDACHFPVFADTGVAPDTLALPDAVLAATEVDDPPTLKEVLVAKAERAAQLVEWVTPYTVRDPDMA